MSVTGEIVATRSQGNQIPFSGATSGFFNGLYDFLYLDNVDATAYDLTLQVVGANLVVFDTTNDVSPNGGNVVQGANSQTVTASRTSPNSLKQINVALGDIPGSLNLDFSGTSNPIPDSFFTYTDAFGTFGTSSSNSGLSVQGGTAHDTINFDGATNTTITEINFYGFSTTSRGFTLYGYQNSDRRYGFYSGVEEINLDLNLLEEFYWDGVDANETINITNPSSHLHEIFSYHGSNTHY